MPGGFTLLGKDEDWKNRSLSDEMISDMSSIFRALGDPTRIRIIHALVQSEMCVDDLAKKLKMTQSAISHQLRYLKNMKIVKRRKEGRSAFYRLDDDHIFTLFLTCWEHASHRKGP
jgi:DNA-binding transcriptional ArsR family regulator